MEHYFLYIFNEFSTNEEAFLEHYIKCLVPSHKELGSELFYSNLLHNSVYCNAININLEVAKNVEWDKINSLEVDKLIPAQNRIENQDKTNTVCDSSLIADCINSLADQLPVCGTFKLDVIISDQVIVNFNINDNIEFAQSLHRLSKWHSSHTIFVTSDKIDRSEFKEWFMLTDAETLKNDSKLNHQSLVWRGSIEVNTSAQNCEGFELRFNEEGELSPHSLPTTSTLNSSDHKNLILHPVLRAIDFCSFSSIPQHLLLPIRFTLYSCSCRLNDSATQFLDHFSGSNEGALIVRLGYSILNEKPKPDKSLCTSKWQKMIASGNVKYPDSLLPYVDSYQTLAITKLPTTDNLAVYFFREPSSFNAQFYFNAVNSSVTQSVRKNNTKRNEKCNFNVPFLSEDAFQSQLLKIQNSSENTRFENNKSPKNLNDLISSFIDTAVSSSTSTLPLNRRLKVVYDEIDPTDWPERVYLLHKQIQIEEENKNIRSVFLNLSPQRSIYNVSLSGDDIKKYFLPSGQAKDNYKAEPVQLLSDQLMTNRDKLDDVLHKQWPDVLNCAYADIYYNVNQQSEEKESVRNEMVRCYVQHETASTCNKQQNLPDAPISVQAKYLTPRKRPKTSKLETSLRQDMMKPNARVKENIFKTADVHCNPVISTIIKTLGVKKSPQTTENLSQKRVPRKNSFPVRCSPRKKTSVNYFPSTSRQLSFKQSKTSPNEMPELLKKKLRVAVASALDSNEISMTHSLFRPCFKKLFTICQTFVQDIPRTGRTSEHMKKIADAHVKQVIKFEKQKETEQ